MPPTSIASSRRRCSMAQKRASMREGPLAELFKATEAAQRQQDPPAAPEQPPAEEPHESTVEHVPTWEDEVETPMPPVPDPQPEPEPQPEPPAPTPAVPVPVAGPRPAPRPPAAAAGADATACLDSGAAGHALLRADARTGT